MLGVAGNSSCKDCVVIKIAHNLGNADHELYVLWYKCYLDICICLDLHDLSSTCTHFIKSLGYHMSFNAWTQNMCERRQLETATTQIDRLKIMLMMIRPQPKVSVICSSADPLSDHAVVA